jgi:hypothetical protein
MQSWEEQFIAVQDDFKVLQLWYKKPKKPVPFFPNRAPLVNPYSAPSSHDSTNSPSGKTFVNNSGRSNGGQNFTSNYTHFSMDHIVNLNEYY